MGQSMATVIFDFDSTLITCESLEEIVKIAAPDKLQEIRKITNQGMSGEIDFLTSLKKRLSLVSLTRQDFINFGERAHQYLTPGIAELISTLQSQGVDIWVVSGAPREVILPLGKKLNIPEEHLLGISLEWTPDGHVGGVNETIPINRSKWEGAEVVHKRWSLPRIAVGDGVTDYALLTHGLVDHFIAFTQNVRREALTGKEVLEARNLQELKRQLATILLIP